jgi:hypothetical protein
VFAWAEEAEADRVEAAMGAAFRDHGLEARAYHAPVDSPGVRLEPLADSLARGAAA